MKVGLVADTHVGRNVPRILGELRRDAYRSAFSKAIDVFANEGVDYVIHAGDLFEKRSMTPSDSMFVKNEFHRLISSIKRSHGKNVKIVVLRGNHDGTPEGSALDYVKHPLAEYLKVVGDEILKGNVELFDDGRLSVVAVGYHPYIASKFKEIEPILKESLSKASGKRFFALHAFVSGYHDVPPGVSRHSVLTLNELKGLEADTIVCGHHHARKELIRLNGKRIITPGATEAIDLSDEGEHGIFIMEGDSCRFVPIEPLHRIRNVKVSSNGSLKPLEWFVKGAEARLSSYASELRSTNKIGILRLVLEGKSIEDPFRLDAELDNLIAKARELNPSLLHVQVENTIESVKQTFFKPLGGQEEFLQEALKPLSDLLGDAMQIVDDVDVSLDEKASQRTGLLTSSDRQPFIEKWIELLRRRTER